MKSAIRSSGEGSPEPPDASWWGFVQEGCYCRQSGEPWLLAVCLEVPGKRHGRGSGHDACTAGGEGGVGLPGLCPHHGVLAHCRGTALASEAGRSPPSTQHFLRPTCSAGLVQPPVRWRQQVAHSACDVSNLVQLLLYRLSEESQERHV